MRKKQLAQIEATFRRATELNLSATRETNIALHRSNELKQKEIEQKQKEIESRNRVDISLKEYEDLKRKISEMECALAAKNFFIDTLRIPPKCFENIRTESIRTETVFDPCSMTTRYEISFICNGRLGII